MRKQFLIPFCAIIALLAIVLMWLAAHRERMPDQPSEAQAPDTNASAVENPVRQSVAVRQTNSAVNVATPKDAESKPTTLEEANAKIRQMLEARNKPVELWGKVVDQDGVSLSGVTVKTEINHFVWPPEQYPNGVSTKQEITTDADGQFHVSDNSATGIHVMLQKAGYEQESRNGYGSNGQNGSQENPAILKMWSTNTHQKLITGENHFHIVPDGRPYFINLTDGTISESVGADLKVWIQYTNQVVRGQPYDWSAGIEVINGGLQETDSYEMFVAPTDGYIPSFQLKGQIKGGQTGNIGDRRFYIMLKNGQEYGRMEIEMIAPYNLSMGIPGMIRFSYAINPSGSRILR